MKQIGKGDIQPQELEERLRERHRWLAGEEDFHLVEAFHRRGLCHCDLKRAANVLVGDDGRPYIIDWSAAILEKEFKFFPARLIYKRFLLDDRHAVIKFQLRHCPEAIHPEDLRRYQDRSAVERAVRKLRDRARRFLQKVA